MFNAIEIYNTKVIATNPANISLDHSILYSAHFVTVAMIFALISVLPRRVEEKRGLSPFQENLQFFRSEMLYSSTLVMHSECKSRMLSPQT